MAESLPLQLARERMTRQLEQETGRVVGHLLSQQERWKARRAVRTVQSQIDSLTNDRRA